MPVITISRQTGSGGAAIGQLLAERLGASYLNTQIIQEVAHRLGISEATAAEHSERSEAFIERLARVLWVSNPNFGTINSPATALPFESITEASVNTTRQIIREAAQTGNVVIFGHGSQFILAKQPNVLHVRFMAPFVDRVTRVMGRRNINRAEAERWVREEDQRRTEHIRQFYQADWHAPDPFHLLLNTSLLSAESCIRLIQAALAELPQAADPQPTQH
ncbi:MAG: cytidylate kinase-like family protein [Caldilineaceae bacterium]